MAARVRPQELRLVHGRRVADHVGERLAGWQVEVRGDLSELEVEVDHDRAARLAQRRRHAEVDGDGRDADAALGREHDDQAAPLPPRSAPMTEATGVRSRARWKRRMSASTRASSSRGSNGRGHDVVGAGLEEGDPLLDLVAPGDAMTGTAARAGVARSSRQSSAAVRGPATRSSRMSWWSGAFRRASSGSTSQGDEVTLRRQDHGEVLGGGDRRRRRGGWRLDGTKATPGMRRLKGPHEDTSVGRARLRPSFRLRAGVLRQAGHPHRKE